MRYSTKLINGDWYVVDSLTADKVKKCPTKFEAQLTANEYNGVSETESLFAMAFGV